jgi:hypothetical protein
VLLAALRGVGSNDPPAPPPAARGVAAAEADAEAAAARQSSRARATAAVVGARAPPGPAPAPTPARPVSLRGVLAPLREPPASEARWLSAQLLARDIPSGRTRTPAAAAAAALAAKRAACRPRSAADGVPSASKDATPTRARP